MCHQMEKTKYTIRARDLTAKHKTVNALVRQYYIPLNQEQKFIDLGTRV